MIQFGNGFMYKLDVTRRLGTVIHIHTKLRACVSLEQYITVF